MHYLRAAFVLVTFPANNDAAPPATEKKKAAPKQQAPSFKDVVAGGTDPATKDTPRQDYRTKSGDVPVRPKVPKEPDVVPTPSDRGFQYVYKTPDPTERARKSKMIDDATVEIQERSRSSTKVRGQE